jgi:hypothetical protein
MTDKETDLEVLVDYITGAPVPHVGAEEARQRVERYLVEEKGYLKNDICVNAPIVIDVAGETYASCLDLVVSVENRSVMVIKCAAGSLESRQREVVSAARILESLPIPRAVVSDGKTAVIYDAVSGGKMAEGLNRIPSRAEALALLSGFQPETISDQKREKEKIIFRSYDSMNVNVCRI